MEPYNQRSDIFAYSKSLRTWPEEIDLPVSIIVNKCNWSMETSPEEIEQFFAEDDTTYNDGPMITVTMDNGASLIIVEIDPEGEVQPEGSLRGDWKHYHKGHEEKLFPIIEIARKILKKTVNEFPNNNINVTVTPQVIKDLAVALAESEGHSPEEVAKKPHMMKRFGRQALIVVKMLKLRGESQRKKK